MAAHVGTRDRRQFLSGSLAGFTSVSLGSLVAGTAHAEPATAGTSGAYAIRGLFPAGAPAAAAGYSPGVEARGSRVIFVSGQGPENLKADMETQIRQTFERIGRVLEAAGATFSNVVMVRAYFVHLSRDLPIYRKVRKDFLKTPYPASTSLGTTELAIPGLEIEIEAVAVI